jgi:hypothetical protein
MWCLWFPLQILGVLGCVLLNYVLDVYGFPANFRVLVLRICSLCVGCLRVSLQISGFLCLRVVRYVLDVYGFPAKF